MRQCQRQVSQGFRQPCGSAPFLDAAGALDEIFDRRALVEHSDGDHRSELVEVPAPGSDEDLARPRAGAKAPELGRIGNIVQD